MLWGRCYEGDGAPAYWPWVQIIRSHVHDRDPRTISSEMGSGAADIAQVVSEVRDSLPGLPVPPELEPEQARFRLFDSITTFFKTASHNEPLVLIIDDLQWADRPTLLLLQFLIPELRRSRVLVLGTYRDPDVTPDHPLWEVIGTLQRQHHAYERIALGGLTLEETRAMLETAAQHELDVHQLQLAEAVYAETNGNPFFIEEVIRHLVETRAALSRGRALDHGRHPGGGPRDPGRGARNDRKTCGATLRRVQPGPPRRLSDRARVQSRIARARV